MLTSDRPIFQVTSRITLLVMLLGCPGDDKVVDSEGTPTEDSHTAQDTDPCADILWYPDVDGDGFGDAASPPLSACEAPVGMVSGHDDCDDTDPNIYPGAPEICMDGVVSDCAGADEGATEQACSPGGPFDLTYADTKLLGSVESDGGGKRVWCAGDNNGDGFSDMLVWTRTPGVALVLGPVSGRFELEDAYAFVYTESLVASGGDLDLDGYSDVLTSLYDTARSSLVLYGPLSGEVPLSGGPALYSTYSVDLDDSWTDVDDNAGTELAAPGDLNGDGWGDVLVGAPAYSGDFPSSEEEGCGEGSGVSWPEGTYFGATYVVYGPVTADRDLSGADGLLRGESWGDVAGGSLSEVGDLDGDGLADVYVGAGGQCEGGVDAGAAYVVLGPAGGELSLADADMKLIGAGTDSGDWMTISGAGDTNGDGYTDLLVGTPSYDGRAGSGGRAMLVLGPPGADRSLNAADAIWLGEYLGWVGQSVAGAGDVDRDGQADILIGATNYTYDEDVGLYQDDNGAAALVYGPMSGTTTYSSLSTVFLGPNDNDRVGESLAGAGDVDADGLPDLLIGARYDDEAGEDAGAAYLIYGSSPFLSGTFGP